MALDFPANPTNGQTWEGDNGVVYTFVSGGIGEGYWSGTSTGDGDGGGNSNIHIGENPPVSPAPGDLWWDESMDSGRLYIYYQDEGDQGNGNSSQWVEASPSGGFDKNENEYWMKGGSDLKPITDTDNVVIGGSNIRLNADGSAEFGLPVHMGTDNTNAVSNSTLIIRGNPAASFVEGNIELSRDGIPDTANKSLGSLFFTDNDSNIAARIIASADAGFTASSLPTSIRFETVEINSVTLQERARITNDGNFALGGTLPSAPNISLNADGSAEFASTVTTGTKSPTEGTGFGVLAYSNTTSDATGSVVGRNYGAGSNFVGIDGAGDKTVDIKANGSANFAGTIQSAGRYLCLRETTDNSLNFFMARNANLAGGAYHHVMTGEGYYIGGSSPTGENAKISLFMNGDANFTGNVTPSNVVLNLEADDDTKYTTTTDEDGNETRVYNGETLDVKALLLTLQTAASRIETLETANASLEARLTALEGAN